MIFNGALVDAEFPGDNFTGVAAYDQIQDLALTWRQTRDTTRRGFSRGEQRVHDTALSRLHLLISLTTQGLHFREGFAQSRFLSRQLAVKVRVRTALRVLEAWDMRTRGGVSHHVVNLSWSETVGADENFQRDSRTALTWINSVGYPT